MAEFIHPFYFVPAKTPKDDQKTSEHWISLQPEGTTSSEENASQRQEHGRQLQPETLNHATHHHYHKDTRSGRICCRLTTKTPTVFGGEQERDSNNNGPTQVHPFERGDKPAIPATTLKGHIASMAEAASCSSLRILEDEKYSRRADITSEVMSAMGLIVKGGENNKELQLVPLARPLMKLGLSKDKAYTTMFPDFPSFTQGIKNAAQKKRKGN